MVFRRPGRALARHGIISMRIRYLLIEENPGSSPGRRMKLSTPLIGNSIAHEPQAHPVATAAPARYRATTDTGGRGGYRLLRSVHEASL